MLTTQSHTHAGFSIIEVIIFISVLGIILVAALGFTMRMVVSMRVNEHKLRASYYTEEVKEWLDGEREAGWVDFEKFAAIGGSAYCINQNLALSDTLASIPSGTCSANGLTPAIYRRELILEKTQPGTATRVTATIRVSWIDSGVQYIEQIKTLYSVWE